MLPARSERSRAAYSLRRDGVLVVSKFLLAPIGFSCPFGCRQPAEQVAPPAFSPDGGSFLDWVGVTISCATDGAAIRYTTDGTDSVGSSTEYTGSIRLTSTTTLKARAFAGGMDDSHVASAAFTVSPAAKYAFVAKWGGFGTSDGELDGPTGMAVDASGNVYVLDSRNDRIQKLAPAP